MGWLFLYLLIFVTIVAGKMTDEMKNVWAFLALALTVITDKHEAGVKDAQSQHATQTHLS